MSQFDCEGYVEEKRHSSRGSIIILREYRTVESATSSPLRELKVFTQESGGVEHVQGDLLSVAIDFIADWVGVILNSSNSSIPQPAADAPAK